MDEGRFREVLGSYPTGVTVVTARDPEGDPFGLTVNSFTSVSLDPPLVLVCVNADASSHDALMEAGSFAVSILSRGQDPVATRFATQPSEGRFEDVDWDENALGDPVIRGAAAWLACQPHRIHPGGDHSIVVGEVVAVEDAGGEPLAYHRGRFGAFLP